MTCTPMTCTPWQHRARILCSAAVPLSSTAANQDSRELTGPVTGRSKKTHETSDLPCHKITNIDVDQPSTFAKQLSYTNLNFWWNTWLIIHNYGNSPCFIGKSTKHIHQWHHDNIDHIDIASPWDTHQSLVLPFLFGGSAWRFSGFGTTDLFSDIKQLIPI